MINAIKKAKEEIKVVSVRLVKIVSLAEESFICIESQETTHRPFKTNKRIQQRGLIQDKFTKIKPSLLY